MPLSWNEIKSRATIFSKEWENEVSEDAEAKYFWDDFFQVFGIGRRRVATFEQQVQKVGKKTGFIDLLWKGVLLVEHKSRGRDLDKAYQQAKDYFPGLNEKELPRYILVSDFERFRLYDLDEKVHAEFKLSEFVNNVHLFGFIAGYQKRTIYKEQDPVNIEAAQLMGRLHDSLKSIGYKGHDLELYLVRLLFCLFADDTSIFERDIFHEYIDLKTNQDGSDLALHIGQIFSILNTEKEKRLKNIDENLDQFPYVNGKLFQEPLPFASFDSSMRNILLECCLLDWSKISPAIFGSLFQSVMDEKARRNLGAHYTSETNILKVVHPLFLDDLNKEFLSVQDSKPKLLRFHEKISSLRFFDPACGCGNFLIIAYRELRMLEIEVIKSLLFKHEKLRREVAAEAGIDVGQLVKCDVDKFFGIEYEEFPAQIAQVAMWLMDHQMNQLVTATFGRHYVRLPLRKSATIIHGNALQVDWNSLISGPDKFDYILGNPPFKGHHYQSDQQKADMAKIFAGVAGYGVLDYVSAWYIKAAEYLTLKNRISIDNKTVCSFVSTSSISQGEQVGILWDRLINKYKLKIHFAHRTFQWTNEAKGNAAVHVVIVGYSNFDKEYKRLFEYNDIKGAAHELQVKNINPYLVEGKDLVIRNRSEPISNVPKMIWGNKPTDGGNLLFETEQEKDLFLKAEPNAQKWIRPFMSGSDFIYNKFRWCLWLKDIKPNELKELKEVVKRVERVKISRQSSKAEATRRKANTPTLFAQISQPDSEYLAIPEVSSERRKYIPIAFMESHVIASNKIQLVPNANAFHFGILTSDMHMTWMRYTCGRLESRYSYSNTIVYNNFPWPQNLSPKQIKAVENAATDVLQIRKSFSDSSLGDLYDPNTMPPALTKAHQILDKAVDLCYRPQAFLTEMKRIEFLFDLYDKYTAGLFPMKYKIKSS